MKFDDLDAKMRVFETAHDHCVLPGIHIVVRLDGRNFTGLTKDVHKFQAPFDSRSHGLRGNAGRRSASQAGPRSGQKPDSHAERGSERKG